MPKVTIVVTPQVMANAVYELMEALSLCNSYTQQQYGGREALPATMSVRVVSPDGLPVIASNGRSVPVDDALPADFDNLIYVAPFAIGAPTSYADALKARAAVSAWLAEAFRSGAIVAASGTGVGVALAAGVGSDLSVPVAWWLERSMHRAFPAVRLDAQRSIEASDKVLLAGRHAAEPALALRIVERIMSPDVAGWIERISGVDPYPDGPDPSLPRVTCDDELVRQAAHWLQLRFARRPRLEDVAEAMAVHPRTLNRRFRTALGTTPAAYLQQLRVEAASRMLARSDRSVERVGYLVGYADSGHFKTVFRRHKGVTPAQFRRQAAQPPV